MFVLWLDGYLTTAFQLKMLSTVGCAFVYLFEISNEVASTRNDVAFVISD